MNTMTKMTVKVHKIMWESFENQLNRVPVKRNKFLNDVIKAEAPRLASAMAGRRLSGRANRWISSELNRLRPTTVSIDIEKSVVGVLNSIVADTHMVRDAFFNRLIAFLRSSDDLLKYFDLPRFEDGTVGKSYGKSIAKPVSPLRSLEDTFDDPLWYLHMAVEEIHQTNLYLLDFPLPKMAGFSCWLEDAQVPGTRSNQRHEREMAEITASMTEFELDAFSPTEPK
jgi:hypothetical protein